MSKLHNLYNTLQNLHLRYNHDGYFYSLPQLEKSTQYKISRLPISIRLLLESVLRNYDGNKITEQHIYQVANWNPKAIRKNEIPFVATRVILQDYTGIPLLADLAAMRNAADKIGLDPNIIQPKVPVDFIVDHSIQTNYTRLVNAAKLNLKLEYKRNIERYQFIKWGNQTFNNLQVIPPGNGIIHQINLEYIAKGVFSRNNLYYPDSVIGTDSHTTMINGMGIMGWGVGGIEAEAGILGQPTYLLEPDVIGVHLQGQLREGVTATDLVLTLTALFRKINVVGKFVEFLGDGTASLTLADRATIANMAPDYGATMGFFPIDETTLKYYKTTGRTDEEIDLIQHYFKAQKLFGIPKLGECDYSKIIEFDLSSVEPCIAGPKRPQDHVYLSEIKSHFENLLVAPSRKNGYEIEKNLVNEKFTADNVTLTHGDILIAAITSCTNTSNPNVLLAAGILAKKAIEKGLTVKSTIKTSLTPGSLVVTEYLKKANLLKPLEKLGFSIAGYGCTTCNGNVGSLDFPLEKILSEHNLIAASVLSGNRNFEARIHPKIRANFLMSPPLVIAFAIAGTIKINFDRDPLGFGKNNKAIFLKDIWPTSDEIKEIMCYATQPETYRKFYTKDKINNVFWNNITAQKSPFYPWDKNSTYIAEPPFLSDFSTKKPLLNNIYHARALAILGDSITTDHISPAGNIGPTSPAGIYLKNKGITENHFNSYGAYRGNHEVMVRGTFSNRQLKNRMIPNTEGGVTIHYPDQKQMSIFDAAHLYQQEQVPSLIFAGKEYGMGSSRDWAAKGTYLLGVRAVIAKSFERIHRSNLIGMGVLPCQFKNTDDVESLDIKGNEEFDILGVDQELKIHQELNLIIKDDTGKIKTVLLILRLDTQTEVEYFQHGGILPFMLRQFHERGIL